MAVPILEYVEGIAHRQLQEDWHAGDSVVKPLQGDHVRVALQAGQDGQGGQDGHDGQGG